MSRLTELVAQVAKNDPALAADLRREVDVLNGRRQFGLNFERHVPESVRLPNRKVRRGDKVVIRDAPTDTWVVAGLEGPVADRKARLVSRASTDVEHVVVPVSDLVVVAEFRDPIFPGLQSTGVVERGGDKPFHTVINGENFHVLQALTFACRGEVDCVYIDPPYNSGARDWKYNNNFVDADDGYRHSKWLAMMERRLLIARELLNPSDSVLIVTIDEREVHRLGLLIEQLFPNATAQMVTIVINHRGVARNREFTRVEEYAFFVFIGEAGPKPHGDDLLSPEQRDTARAGKVRWEWLIKGSNDARRQDRPALFYPIFIDPQKKAIVSIGDAIPLDVDRTTVPVPDGQVAVWPLARDGTEKRWQVSPVTLRKYLADGYAKPGAYDAKNDRWSILYLNRGQRERIDRGEIRILGRDVSGALDLELVTKPARAGMTVWNRGSHNAGYYGSGVISALLPGRKFPFPKSLYAVEDALRFAVGGKPNALILDFFAGSATTAHAVMRLNRQDGGSRRSIVVTNNEVGVEAERKLRAAGLQPGDAEWEAQGICEQITKPRIHAAITGETPEGEPIKGDYKFVDEFPMAEGFEENAEFFDLTYEDPEMVRYGLGFEAIAPLLWFRAGCRGSRINAVDTSFAVGGAYATLFDLDAAAAFVSAVRANQALRVAYVVTDDETQFQVVAAQLPHDLKSVRLYSAYLDNFRIQAGA